MARKERRKFTAEFKREAVKLAERPGRSVTAVARELGVERSVLKKWMDNFAAGHYEKDRALPIKAVQQQENEQLRRNGGQATHVHCDHHLTRSQPCPDQHDLEYTKAYAATPPIRRSRSPKSPVTTRRNDRSRSTETTGHDRRNTQPVTSGLRYGLAPAQPPKPIRRQQASRQQQAPFAECGNRLGRRHR
jgi:transposase